MIGPGAQRQYGKVMDISKPQRRKTKCESMIGPGAQRQYGKVMDISKPQWRKTKCEPVKRAFRRHSAEHRSEKDAPGRHRHQAGDHRHPLPISDTKNDFSAWQFVSGYKMAQ